MFDCSVIIPVYNRSEQVRRAIESVRQQTVAPREIIVVDDGSTDGVADAVRSEHPEVKILTWFDNRGVSAARNRGMAESQGQWIAFLDSDDVWLPSKLQVQSEWLESHSDLSICHCDEIWIRNEVRVNPGKRHKKRGGWIYEYCLPLCVISPSAVLIHRRVFSQVGVFDESLPVCEDYDLWLRMTCLFEVGYVNRPLLIKYGGHSDQLSKAYMGMDRFRIAALEKMLINPILTSEQRLKTISMLTEKITIYLTGARKRDRQSEVEKYEKLLECYSSELLELV